MTKAIERIYQPDEVNTLKFVIKKVNSKKYESMTEAQRLEAIEFIEDCEKDLQRFKDELKK